MQCKLLKLPYMSPTYISFVYIFQTFCFDSFKDCINRITGDRTRRADMVVSVHPLTQDIPLKILNYLDSNGQSRIKGRTTPFVTIGKKWI